MKNFPNLPDRPEAVSPKPHAKISPKMKVVLIYRKRRPGGYSIEEQFDAIATALGTHVEVFKYEVGSRWAIPIDSWRLWNVRADVYHITGDIHYFALLLPRKRTVLTVHDIYHYSRQLQSFKRWLYKWIWLLLPIRAAGTVTAISAETKRTIQSELGITYRDIAVIPNCVNPIFRATPKPFHTARPSILQVGTRPNKNLERVIEALSGIPCLLCIIGPLSVQTCTRLKELGIVYENYVNLRLPEVAQKYAASDLVCFASLYEGFGLPILEAHAIGRPVITSSLAPMDEVAGNAAHLVDPNDVLSIRSGILKVISDQKYRESLIEKGFRNAEKYSPGIVADQFVRLYSRQGSN